MALVCQSKVLCFVCHQVKTAYPLAVGFVHAAYLFDYALYTRIIARDFTRGFGRLHDGLTAHFALYQVNIINRCVAQESEGQKRSHGIHTAAGRHLAGLRREKCALAFFRFSQGLS